MTDPAERGGPTVADPIDIIARFIARNVGEGCAARGPVFCDLPNDPCVCKSEARDCAAAIKAAGFRIVNGELLAQVLERALQDNERCEIEFSCSREEGLKYAAAREKIAALQAPAAHGKG